MTDLSDLKCSEHIPRLRRACGHIEPPFTLLAPTMKRITEIKRHLRGSPCGNCGGQFTVVRGKPRPHNALPDDTVREIRERRQAGERQCDIERELGLAHDTVGKIDRGERYAWVD